MSDRKLQSIIPGAMPATDGIWSKLRAQCIEERMPPGTSEVRHYHQNANHSFYVLRGNLNIEVDGSEPR